MPSDVHTDGITTDEGTELDDSVKRLDEYEMSPL